MKILSSKLLILSFVVITANSCTLFKKNISRPINIAINEQAFTATLNSTAVNAKYITLVSSGQIAEAFLKGFKSEGDNTVNVTMINTEENADFIIKLSSLEIKESSNVQKINNSKSTYNGLEVILNTVECTASVEIINVKKNTKSTFNALNSKSRSEKEKNNRTLLDLIVGTNKDNTQYRTKTLSDHICVNLAEDVGRRIWTPITRKIARNLK